MEERMDSYKIIRQQIVNDIERGIYRPGEIIPKQMEFAEQYGVSRGTIRKALDDLIERGVLITTKGRGTVVAEHKAETRDIYRPLSFSESKRVDPKKLESKVIKIEKLAAAPWLARVLQISVGSEVFYIKRVRILDGSPENYQCSYISQSRIQNLDLANLDLEHHSLFAIIRETTGLYAMKKTEEIRAVRCPQYVAEELRMQEGDPVLLIMRTVYGQDHLPLEYCEDYECTDAKGLVITTEGQIKRECVLEVQDE